MEYSQEIITLFKWALALGEAAGKAVPDSDLKATDFPPVLLKELAACLLLDFSAPC